MVGSDELIAWLRLARTPRLGPIQALKLLDRYKTAAAAVEWLGTAQGLAKANLDRLHSKIEAIKEIDAVSEMGGGFLTYECDAYPQLLRQIPDPPPILSYLGNLDRLSAGTVAIVGARNASGNGCKLAQQLAAEVSSHGLCVVSGLARGIDTSAHRGGLMGIGSTIAVIASGTDIAYPKENRILMDEIAENGLVISERPLGAAPMARHFPRRNRIISGLSRAVVVVEAAEKSGSLMTARLALEHGREVMAVPGSPLDARHRGTNKLLRDGAAMVEQSQDILDNLPEHLRIPAAMAKPKPMPARIEHTRVKKPELNQSKPTKRQSDSLSARLEGLLSAEPLAVDELIRQCHASPSEVQDLLLHMEMDGRISRHPGNRVALELS